MGGDENLRTKYNNLHNSTSTSELRNKIKQVRYVNEFEYSKF